MSDSQSIGAVITPFVMLPGTGPACEGDDCLPAASLPEQQPVS